MGPELNFRLTTEPARPNGRTPVVATPGGSAASFTCS